MSKRSSARRVAVGAMVAVLAIMVRNAAGGGEGVFRVSGWPAEFPSGCQGAMRGVTVRIEPLGREYRTDVADGRFAFEAVSPGNYTLSVSPSCNPFGCWPEMPVSVVDDDVFVRICPVEQTPTPTPTPQPTPFIGPIEISCELRVDPPVPVVGDHVRVTVQQRSTRLGYPSYSLDPNPLFAGSTREQSTSTFELDAVQAGMTTLSGSTRDEFVVGYVNDAPFFSFYGASCTAPVEVLADGPTPTPTPTTATPTFTPTSCVSDEPTVEEVPASVHSLRRTLTGFDRGLYCFRSGSISIDGAGVLALEVDCGSGRYTAEILLTQPDPATTWPRSGSSRAA